MPQFLVLAKDFKDEEALARRLAVRNAHLERMRIEKNAGIFITGGAQLNEAGAMAGSMLLVNGENEEAVKAWLMVDPYITGKVWEEVEIVPFKIADI